MLERWGKDDPEVLTEAIEAIGKETDNMKELVEKLLFIARNDKDTLTLNKGKVFSQRYDGGTCQGDPNGK